MRFLVEFEAGLCDGAKIFLRVFRGAKKTKTQLAVSFGITQPVQPMMLTTLWHLTFGNSPHIIELIIFIYILNFILNSSKISCFDLLKNS